MLSEIFALQRCYAAYIGCYLAMFRDNLSVLFSGVKQFDLDCLKVGQIGCPETSAHNCQSTLRDLQEERRSRVRRGGSFNLRTVCRWELKAVRIQINQHEMSG